MPRSLLVSLVLALTATMTATTPGSAAPSPTPAAATVAPEPSPWWPPAAPTQLTIDTGGAVIGREDYVPGTITLDGVTHVTEVRGRGNSTWTWPKKPYKLKLEDDAALVGSEEFDEWVLLAGYADRSALRTAAAFAIAAQTRLAWTPRFRFVDVVLDGRSQGLYMLTEQVEVGEGRVDVPDEGYLLEINTRYLRDDEPGFRTARRTPVSFKDPDEVTRKQRREVRRAVSQFERVLYGPDFADPRVGYAKYINVKKVIDWYLVEELFRNQDSNFQSSVHFSWVPGQKFRFGPVWDFDLSAGTRFKGQDPAEGWHTRVGGHWIARMLEDPAFSARVKSRWARLRPVVDQVVAQVPSVGATLSASAEADWQLWHASGADLPWSRHGATYTAEVGHVRDFLTRRARWLSRNEVRLGDDHMVTKEKDRTVWVPVQLQSPPTEQVGVDFTVLPGSATAGTDYTATSGRVEFPAGEQVRYVPVRVLDDSARETRENLFVELQDSTPTVGPVVGSPRRVKVVIEGNDASARR